MYITEPIVNTMIQARKYTYLVFLDLSNLLINDSNAPGNTMDVMEIHEHF
jgi:hypothetical protein